MCFKGALPKGNVKKLSKEGLFAFAKSNGMTYNYLYNILYNGGVEMEAVTYSNFRQNLRSYMKQINEDSDTFIVTSKDVEDTVVVMSKRDYDAMQETLRTLSNAYVMDKIRRGDEQFQIGEAKIHELIEVKDD